MFPQGNEGSLYHDDIQCCDGTLYVVEIRNTLLIHFDVITWKKYRSVADPGFPVGGRAPIRGGRGPPTWTLFSENVCENKRIGSHRGGGACAGHAPPRSANVGVLHN